MPKSECPLTQAEKDTVSIAFDEETGDVDETRWVCKLCPQTPKIPKFRKRQALEHFQKIHGKQLDLEAVKSWLVVRDGWTLKRGGDMDRLRLTKAFKEDEHEEEGEEEGGKADRDQFDEGGEGEPEAKREVWGDIGEDGFPGCPGYSAPSEEGQERGQGQGGDEQHKGEADNEEGEEGEAEPPQASSNPAAAGAEKGKGRAMETESRPAQADDLFLFGNSDKSLWRLMFVRVNESGMPLKDPVEMETIDAQTLPAAREAVDEMAAASSSLQYQKFQEPPQLHRLVKPTPKYRAAASAAAPATASSKEKAAPQTPNEKPSSSNLSFSPLTRQIAALVDTIKSGQLGGQAKETVAQAAGIEEPGPKTALTQAVLEWTEADRKIGVQRMRWPFPPCTYVNLDDFAAHLKDKGLDVDVTIPSHIMRLQHFLGMFVDLPESFSFAGFIAELMESGLGKQWAALKVMDSSYPHTNSMKPTLHHFLDFLREDCLLKRHMETVRLLDLFRSQILLPMEAKTKKANNARKTQRKKACAQKLASLPPPEIFQSAIHQSMIDLHYLYKASKSQEAKEADWKLRGAANTIVCGLVFLNIYSGRPGEWSELKRSVVEELVAEGGTVLEFDKHKTAETHGSAARHVPSGNLEAFRKLLKIHPDDSYLFFQPAKAESKLLSIDWALKKFSQVYFPDHQRAGATLQRKFMGTRSRRHTVAEKVWDEVCKMQKHTNGCGENDYVCETPQEQADRDLAIYRGVVGEPVPWPSKDELKEHRAASLLRLESFWCRKRNTSKADEGNPTGGEEEDELDEEGVLEEQDEGEDWLDSEAEAGGSDHEDTLEEDPDEQHEAQATAGEREVVVKEEPEDEDQPSAALTEAEQKLVWQAHLKYNDSNGAPEGGLQRPAWFRALQVVGVKRGLLKEGTTPEMLMLFVRGRLDQGLGSTAPAFAAAAEPKRPPPATAAAPDTAMEAAAAALPTSPPADPATAATATAASPEATAGEAPPVTSEKDEQEAKEQQRNQDKRLAAPPLPAAQPPAKKQASATMKIASSKIAAPTLFFGLQPAPATAPGAEEPAAKKHKGEVRGDLEAQGEQKGDEQKDKEAKAKAASAPLTDKQKDEATAKEDPPTDYRQIAGTRTKIKKDLEIWIIEQNLRAPGGDTRALSAGWYKGLRKKALELKWFKDAEGPSHQGMRTVARDYFISLANGGPALTLAAKENDEKDNDGNPEEADESKGEGEEGENID